MANNTDLRVARNDRRPGTGPNSTNSEIDLIELALVLWHWAWLIILVGLVGGIIGFCYSKFVLPEQFESTTTVYVLNMSTNGEAVSQSEMSAGTQLTKDCNALITSRSVLEEVIEELQLHTTPKQLKNQIKVTTPTDTRLTTITVTDTDPAMAQRIANSVREISGEHIVNIMAIDAVNVVDYANYPTEKSAPSNSKNTLGGVLIGMLLVSCIVTIQYMLDDTIKTGEDIEKYLGRSALALVPKDEGVTVGVSNGTGKKRKRKRSH